MKKKNTIIKYVVIGSVVLSWPILHIFVLLGPYVSLLVFPYFLFFSKSKTKIVDTLIRAFSVGLGVLLISVICAYLVSLEYNMLIHYQLPKTTGPVSFYISGDKEYNVNEVFPVVVGIKGVTNAVNAVKVDLKFDPHYLEAIDVSIEKSFATVFIDKKIHNSDGFITITGGLPNPGFSSDSGEFVTAYFIAKKKGTTKIEVSATSGISANDGFGSNVFDNKTQVKPITIENSFNNSKNSYTVKSVKYMVDDETSHTTKRLYFNHNQVFHADRKPIDYNNGSYLSVLNAVISKIIQLDSMILSHYYNFSLFFTHNK